MGPARLSRRSLLRGAASVAVLAACAAVSSCADGQPRASDPDAPDDASSLLRLGHSIVDGAGARPSGSSTSTSTSDAPTVASDADAVRAIDLLADEVRSDFSQGQTVIAAGWLLAASEAEVLASYAGACPLPAC